MKASQNGRQSAGVRGGDRHDLDDHSSSDCPHHFLLRPRLQSLEEAEGAVGEFLGNGSQVCENQKMMKCHRSVKSFILQVEFREVLLHSQTPG